MTRIKKFKFDSAEYVREQGWDLAAMSAVVEEGGLAAEDKRRIRAKAMKQGLAEWKLDLECGKAEDQLFGYCIRYVREAGEADEAYTDNSEIIRAKWIIDGAKSLSEAAEMLRERAEQYIQMEKEGWQLTGPIDDDYGYIEKRSD